MDENRKIEFSCVERSERLFSRENVWIATKIKHIWIYSRSLVKKMLFTTNFQLSTAFDGLTKCGKFMVQINNVIIIMSRNRKWYDSKN